MMIKYILMPFLEGIIGYITNGIAIKMLFRPRKAVYLGHWKIPFTPGLIPQQKDRIARSIGDMASRLLLNGETLRASVLAPETLMDLRDKVTGFIGGLSYNTDTVEEFLGQHLGAEKVSAGADFLEDAVAELLSKKIAESDIGAVVVGRSIAQLKETLGIGLHAMLFTGEAMSQIESAIAARINDLIGKMAPDVIKEEVQKLGRDIRSARLCDVYSKYQDRIPWLVDRIVVLYEKELGDNLERITQAVDIGGIVCQKIAAFDAKELENLIFGIMNRELKAIVYLGALLGFLMGFINILFL